MPGPGGRPKIEFSWDEFDKLCEMLCTREEIANFFECSEDTVGRRVQEEFSCTFKELWEKKSAKGKISLRRAQKELAEKGNATMLIWLGKQYLDQRDKAEVSSSPEHPPRLIINFDEEISD